MRFDFVKSAILPRDYPVSNRPEIVVCGRSNSGKSSFLNAIAKTKIAKVSSTPGKTRTLNFFKTDFVFDFVDVPGYGYAARGGKERDLWSGMMENFFSCRGNISGVYLIIDVRRSWSNDEEEFAQFLQSIDIPLAVILTKSDKLGRMQQKKAEASMRKTLGSDLVFLVSSTKRTGIQEVLKFSKENWSE